MTRRVFAAVAVVLLLAACGTTRTVTIRTGARLPAPSASDHGNSEAVHGITTRCGIERWPVKTGTDPDAAKVDTGTVQPTTIVHLAAIPAPTVLPQASRIAPVEMTVYQVTATLKEFKQEADSDYHLVLSDGTQTMIAEIPDPACVGASSPFLVAITKARAAFDARYQPSGVWQQSGVQVTVTGVGFFDDIHGQTGVAKNGIEEHPVLGVTFRSGS